jgi:hypothetical protein
MGGKVQTEIHSDYAHLAQNRVIQDSFTDKMSLLNAKNCTFAIY